LDDEKMKAKEKKFNALFEKNKIKKTLNIKNIDLTNRK